MIRPFVSYLIWHYSKSIADFFGIVHNFLWFLWHFFSIPILAKTLLAPWQRLGEDHHRGEGVEGFFEVIVLNIIMRIVGFIVRGCIIVFGLFVISIVLLLSVMIFVMWMALPLIIVVLLISGIRLIFK